MKQRFIWFSGVVVLLAGALGYLRYQDTLVPILLASEVPRFVAAAPEYGEEGTVIEALLPAGDQLDAFLANQSDLALIGLNGDGQLVGQLLSELAGTRHGRRWRLKVRPGWPMQEGGLLDAARLVKAIQPEVSRMGGTLQTLDSATVELRFGGRQSALPAELAHWRVPGSGPFIRKGTTLVRFDGFKHGRAGIAGLRVFTDAALMESRAWAEGLAAGRWAFTRFPGTIAPDDMARIRLAPYDEFRLKDGSVWFLSRRMRRLRPHAEDWTQTRLFGVWKGAMDLPYDPLGL